AGPGRSAGALAPGPGAPGPRRAGGRRRAPAQCSSGGSRARGAQGPAAWAPPPWVHDDLFGLNAPGPGVRGPALWRREPWATLQASGHDGGRGWMGGEEAAMDRHQLLHEGVVAKFLRYVQVETTSAEEPQTIPSTPGQWELARMLAAELQAMGLTDVEVDEHAFVTATLPARGAEHAPVIGFLAHMDTSPAAPGRNVKPILHRAYPGGPIQLPAGPVLREEEQPLLREVIGHDLITSSGDTLLGADNKAGIAVIMEALARLLRDPSHIHGTLRIAFTPDEENGSGIALFDPARFGAVAAYTVDGGPLGELEWENFNALNLRVVIEGRAAHTGTARGTMINSLHLAAQLIGSVPA